VLVLAVQVRVTEHGDVVLAVAIRLVGGAGGTTEADASVELALSTPPGPVAAVTT
jgi:hypothetical protein